MMAYFNFVYDYFEITTATAAIRALTIRYRKKEKWKKCRKCFTNIPFMRQPQNDINY
jgi:hypothetical protein